MPTISVYLTKQNYIEVQSEENISAYINRLISEDKGDSVNGKPVVSKTTTVGSTPASPAKVYEPIDDVKPTTIEELKKLDPTLTTAREYRPPMFKEKKKSRGR